MATLLLDILTNGPVEAYSNIQIASRFDFTHTYTKLHYKLGRYGKTLTQSIHSHLVSWPHSVSMPHAQKLGVHETLEKLGGPGPGEEAIC